MSDEREMAEFIGGPKNGEQIQVHRDDIAVRFYSGDVLMYTLTDHFDYRRDPQAMLPTFVFLPPHA